MSNPAPEPVSSEPSRNGWLSRLRHDLRTPLNGVIGYTEMLLEDLSEETPASFSEGLRAVLDSGRRFLATLAELLSAAGELAGDPSGAEQAGRRLKQVLGQPVAAVREKVAGLEAQAQALGRTEMLPDLGKIRVALGRLEKMLEQAAAAAPAAEQPPAPAGAQGTARQLDAAPAPSAHAAPRALILVVDDNEMNRDVLSRRLRREGHEVVTATGGAEALATIRRQAFDIVLLDLMMPDMDGDEVLLAIKSDLGLRDLPVIMLSALDDMSAVTRCIEMGADDYLPKPFDPVLLRARIGAGLERRRWRAREVEYLQRIELERDRAEELLRVILPDEVIPELKSTHQVKPRRCENVAVLFCDIVGFTPWCENRAPEEIHGVLQAMNVSFEELAEETGLQKIKTIGDAFMAVAGLLEPSPNPVLACVRAGLRMVQAAPGVLQGGQVRVGIHAGPVIAGVIGRKKYLFDVWGDTVNVAARIESSGLPGTVSVGKGAWEQLDGSCSGRSRGRVSLKGRGELEVFLVDAVKE
jgi:CheY-like chemotaxis protein